MYVFTLKGLIRGLPQVSEATPGERVTLCTAAAALLPKPDKLHHSGVRRVDQDAMGFRLKRDAPVG